MRKTTLAAFALASTAVLAGACAPTPAPPTAPGTIAGDGRYDYTVLLNGEPNFVGGNPAEVALTDDGTGLYAGTVLSENGGPQGYFELTTNGHDITHLYTRDAAAGPGEGFELDTDAVTATAITGGACPGAGLEIEFSGGYSIDGVPSSEFSADATVTVCDPAAAAWFG